MADLQWPVLGLVYSGRETPSSTCSYKKPVVLPLGSIRSAHVTSETRPCPRHGQHHFPLREVIAFRRRQNVARQRPLSFSPNGAQAEVSAFGSIASTTGIFKVGTKRWLLRAEQGRRRSGPAGPERWLQAE